MNYLKKPWVSMLLILVALVAAGVGSFAYFTATRTAEDNTFTAGTLDLSVTGENSIANEPFIIENMGANANLDGSATWTIENTASLPGRLLVRIVDLENFENGCNDQEESVEPACADDNLGEFGGVVNAVIALDGIDQVSSTLATNDLEVMGDDWNDLVLPVIMNPGDTHEITFHWATDENAYGNEIQSDSVRFDLVIQLIQDIDGPTPANRGEVNVFGAL
jgi:predicted ribosomally synthesized peptide with SipW-like signal peptide